MITQAPSLPSIIEILSIWFGYEIWCVVNQIFIILMHNIYQWASNLQRMRIWSNVFHIKINHTFFSLEIYFKIMMNLKVIFIELSLHHKQKWYILLVAPVNEFPVSITPALSFYRLLLFRLWVQSGHLIWPIGQDQAWHSQRPEKVLAHFCFLSCSSAFRMWTFPG